MHSTAQTFFAMSAAQKQRVHLFLADVALTQWNSFFAAGQVPKSYQETVAGTIQEVDENLPTDALSCARARSDKCNVAIRYREPICALQDEDWCLPDNAQFAYYAIYNTFQKYAVGKDIDDWLIVNQALSSLGEPVENVGPVFEAALNEAA